MKGVRKPTKIIGQDSRFPVRDLRTAYLKMDGRRRQNMLSNTKSVSFARCRHLQCRHSSITLIRGATFKSSFTSTRPGNGSHTFGYPAVWLQTDLVLECELSCCFISSSSLLLTKATPLAMDSAMFWVSEHNEPMIISRVYNMHDAYSGMLLCNWTIRAHQMQ
jgi:hypothetical protein